MYNACMLRCLWFNFNPTDRLTEICPKPISPEHGNVNITGRKFNDSLTVVCDEGYHYTGTLVRRCHGNGHWSGGVGYCKGNAVIPLEGILALSGSLIHNYND